MESRVNPNPSGCLIQERLRKALWDFDTPVEVALIAPALALVLLLATNGIAQSLTGTATKIEVVNESPVLTVGSEAQLRIELLDPKNNPAKADKDFTIKLEAHTLSGVGETIDVLIKAGGDSQIAHLPLKEAGPLKVSASNKELVTGGIILNVRSSRSQRRNIESTELIRCAFSGETFSSTTCRPIRRLVIIAANEPSPSPVPTIAESPPSWVPSVTFMCYPERKFAADKKDVAHIYAALGPNDVAQWDIYFSLMSSAGPATIVIRKGEDHGETQLGTDRAGTVTVSFLGSNPWPREISGVPMQINFAPPVAALRVRPNPPRIYLFESPEIAVELVDGDGNPIRTDEQSVDVSLEVDSGTGELDNTKLQIEANHYDVTTKFQPIGLGSVGLTARSPNLREDHTALIVLDPTLILVLCGVGGLAGGLLAFWSENARWPRIPIGLITGFVLYWLLTFGLVHIPNFPHGAVFNPASAAIISLLGGWGGTKTLTFALERVGIKF